MALCFVSFLFSFRFLFCTKKEYGKQTSKVWKQLSLSFFGQLNTSSYRREAKWLVKEGHNWRPNKLNGLHTNILVNSYITGSPNSTYSNNYPIGLSLIELDWPISTSTPIANPPFSRIVSAFRFVVCPFIWF